MSEDLFGDAASAKADRDAALKRVREHGGDWEAKAISALPLLLPGFDGTAEDIRIRLMMKNFPQPHHHNAWGSMIKRAVERKVLIPTGKWRSMKGSKSHARRTPIYIVKS